jgi:hypothetical protein
MDIRRQTHAGMRPTTSRGSAPIADLSGYRGAVRDHLCGRGRVHSIAVGSTVANLHSGRFAGPGPPEFHEHVDRRNISIRLRHVFCRRRQRCCPVPGLQLGRIQLVGRRPADHRAPSCGRIRDVDGDSHDAAGELNFVHHRDLRWFGVVLRHPNRTDDDELSADVFSYYRM